MPTPRQLKDKELLQSWIDAIKDEAWEKLSEWEQNFVESIESQLKTYGHLSFKQEDKLESIYAEYTS